MKKFMKFICTLLLTGTMCLCLLVISSRIFVPKWTNHNMNMMTFIIKGLYAEKENSIDVLISGNSDTYRGISPMTMYHEYGIASYSYVSSGQRMWHAYAMVKDALRKQKPKMLLFNVDGVFSTSQASVGNNNKVYDNMELSSVKIDAIMDKHYKASLKKRLSHILPIFSYHDRYNELTGEDFKYIFYNFYYPLKGMDMVAYRVPYTGDKNYMKDKGETIEIPKDNLEYLDKIKELCDKNDITFVLFHVPTSDSANYAKYKAIKEYADARDLDYLEMNLFNDEIGIDWSTDTSDGGDHLNLFGAEKTSSYLGKYLTENYSLPDRRNDTSYSNWNDDYEYYLKQREIEINDAISEGKY